MLSSIDKLQHRQSQTPTRVDWFTPLTTHKLPQKSMQSYAAAGWKDDAAITEIESTGSYDQQTDLWRITGQAPWNIVAGQVHKHQMASANW